MNRSTGNGLGVTRQFPCGSISFSQQYRQACFLIAMIKSLYRHWRRPRHFAEQEKKQLYGAFFLRLPHAKTTVITAVAAPFLGFFSIQPRDDRR